MSVTDLITLLVLATPTAGALFGFYRRSVTREAERLTAEDRAKTYKEKAEATIASKDEEIKLLRQRIEDLTTINEQQQKPSPRRRSRSSRSPQSEPPS